MYLTETDQTLSKEQVQSNLVKSAVAFLASQCDGSHENDKAGFNKVDSEFGHSLAQIIKQAGSLSFGQEYAAWKMCRKYWRQLRKAEPEIILPKKWVSTYKVDVGTGGSSNLLVWNLSKGSGPYTLELIGDDELSCTCEAYQSGNTCGHIDAVVRLGYLDKLDAEPTSKPLEGELIPFDMGDAPIVTDEDITESEADTEQPYEMLPGVYANDDQLNALNNLKKFAYGESIMYLLTGYAGSGKTTLVQAWLRDLRAEGYSGRIVFTAPTNKAAGVLRSMVNQWGLDVECITCAKLLGLKPKIDFETGKQLFVKDYNAESVIQEYDLVVVDESSMVSEDLWGYLAEEANMFTRILYMGDPAQLPPVNEAISKVFMEVTNKSHLSKVMRYRGSIAAMADEIRSNLGRKSEPCFESQYSEDGSEGLFLLPDKSWYQALIKLFSSDNYVEDPNYCRALAYTNKRVNSINTFVRNEIRGVDSPRFVAGERLIATEHYSIPDIYGGHGRSVILANSAECEVIDAVEGMDGRWKVWFLTVVRFEDGENKLIPVLHEDMVSEFHRTQKELKQQACNGDKSKWQDWHENRQRFSWVDYAYGITIHKAQGSTFINTFVDMGNIMTNKRINTVQMPGEEKKIRVCEKNQLAYVALTRCKKRAFIFE